MRVPLVAIAAVSWSLLAMVPLSHAQGRRGGGGGEGPSQPEASQDMKNIAVARGFWQDLWVGRDGNAVPKYIAEGYTEHFNGSTNGRADLLRRLGHPAGPNAPHQTVVTQTVYAHAPYVLLVQDREVTNPKQPGQTRKVNTIEMLTVYDGQIQEHRQFWPEGHMPANQPQTSEEEKNLAAVKGFMHEMWIPGDGSVAPKYIAWGYIEHGNGNENATNGRADMVRRFGSPGRRELAAETYYARGPIVLLVQDRPAPDRTQPGKTRMTRTIAMFEVYDGLLQQHWLLQAKDHGVWQ